MKVLLPTIILGALASAKRFTETCEDIKISKGVNLTARCRGDNGTLSKDPDYLDVSQCVGIKIATWKNGAATSDAKLWPLDHQGDNTSIYPCQNISLVSCEGARPSANPFSGYCSSTCTRFNNTDHPKNRYYINLGSSTLFHI
jgi:hypothetical protein